MGRFTGGIVIIGGLWPISRLPLFDDDRETVKKKNSPEALLFSKKGG